MKTMSVSNARNQFADLINQVAYQSQRIMILKMGKPVAAIVPISDIAHQKMAPVQPPSTTAGTLKLPPNVKIEDVFSAMAQPYDPNSLLGR